MCLAKRADRFGFTLVELAIVVAVSAIIAALLASALLAVRETSRQLTCRNHLHQLGIALAEAESEWNCFPTRDASLMLSHWPLFPYLEQAPLLERLQGGESAPDGFESLDVMICPSDPVPPTLIGQTNYLPNVGTLFRDSPVLNGFVAQSTRRPSAVGLPPTEFTDGLSQTAALSEGLNGARRSDERLSNNELTRQAGRYLWHTEVRASRLGDEELATEICRTRMTLANPFAPGFHADIWRNWSGYDHLLPPNHRACCNDRPGDGFNSNFDARLMPPSSLHPGGVNVLMADGRVSFVAESIGDSVWRAIGTRAGGESEALR